MNNSTVNQQEIFESLVGKKVTIFKYSEFGFPHSIQGVIEKVERKNYAQYDNLLHIQYRAKRKRASYLWRVMDYNTFAIFAGHVDLDTNMFVTKRISESTGLQIGESLPCFSDGYLDRALASTNRKPILVQRDRNN